MQGSLQVSHSISFFGLVGANCMSCLEMVSCYNASAITWSAGWVSTRWWDWCPADAWRSSGTLLLVQAISAAGWTRRGYHNHLYVVGKVSWAVSLRAFVANNVSEVVIHALVCNVIAMSWTVLSISDLKTHYQPAEAFCTFSHPYERSKKKLSWLSILMLDRTLLPLGLKLLPCSQRHDFSEQQQ